jgi:hypothetical protein
MKTEKIKINNIIILTIVASLFFVLGIYTDYKVNMTNEQSLVISNYDTDLGAARKTVDSDSMTKTNINENDPLIHLKMLQKDVEVFKALMEEVKKELFVSDKA